MWLINTHTLRLEHFTSGPTLPPYAILSHTWALDEEEVSFSEMMLEVRKPSTVQKPGYAKIEKTCELARTREPGLQYAWVDTCTIDKSSSAELSEAINSMFTWYRKAAVCFVYLSDLSKDSFSLAWEECRWWRRGWTLQVQLISRSF